MKKSGLAAVIALLILLPFFAVQACGPDFRPDVFVRNLRPDHPKEFAAGKLGVLLPTYPRMDLMVAFRYLNGGKLSAEEQKAYTPTYTLFEEEWSRDADAPASPPVDAAAAWKTLRQKYARVSPVQESGDDVQTPPFASYQSEFFLNCNDDAFYTAMRTLQLRADAWGGNSLVLADWLRGQDTVFANCSGKEAVLPAAAPKDTPALLKADRAYQTGAALFYMRKFNDARSIFAGISADSTSPWQGIAGYIEARCLIRQAFLSARSNAGEAPGYDPELLKQGGALLQSMVHKPHPGISDEAINRQLNLINIRLEPEAQLHKLGIALAGPEADTNYTQDLRDIAWFLNQKLSSVPFRVDTESYYFLTDEQKKNNWAAKPTEDQRTAIFNRTYEDTAIWRETSSLADWTLTFQSPAIGAKIHALSEWKKTNTLYWLVAALAKADGKDAEAAQLIRAAERIDSGSSASTMLVYHRARLLLEDGRAAEAKLLLDKTMPELQAQNLESAANLYENLRMAASTSLDEFLRYAPQKILLRSSEASSASRECLEVMKDPKRSYDCAKTLDADQFSDAAAGFLNAQAPLNVLVAAAKSDALPPQLKQPVAMMAWTRSILLHDDAAAKALLPLLPAKLRLQAGDGTGFAAIMALARNPGLRPYLESGVQRSYTYDFIESYRDNWWCNGLAPNWASSSAPFAAETPAFLTPEQRKEAQAQREALSAQEGAQLYLGNLILAYAQNHADDPRTPEALFLVLRMVRYGCDRQTYTPDGKPSPEALKEDALKKEVSRLLRQRYASSPWTKKAAPFAG